MRTFFLDLASHDGLLACVEPNRVIASAPVDHRIRDDELMPIVDRVLKEAGWDMKTIERIACVSGPGGFTSLRVAAAFANALAFTVDCPVAGIHLSDLHAVRMQEKNFIWLHSTKKTQLFARGFGNMEKLFPEATAHDLPSFLPVLPQKTIWTGELIPEHETAIASRGTLRAELMPLTTVLPSFLDTLKYSKGTLEPWYGRGW